MEFVLIHRQLGPLPLEMLKKAVEIAKKFVVDPQEFVPGGKLIAAYNTLAQSAVVCIWEVPSLDALMPFLEQLNALGWETEIIPAEKMEVHIPKLEKMLAQMAGS